MLADECINKCMQYLEAVGWSAEEELQIRKVLSSEGLKLKLLPDLAARLRRDNDDDHINFVEKIIQEMVSVIKKGEHMSKNFETVEKDLIGILDGNASREFVEVCGRVLLEEFQASINSHCFPHLTRFFKLIQHCNGAILEAALKTFCEDAEFMEYLKNNAGLRYNPLPVFDIIMGFMKAIGEGKLIISRASRVSFLTNWLPIMESFAWDRSLQNRFEELHKAVLNVVETLPTVDQKRICVVWVETYRQNDIDISMPLTLSKSL
ncbi:hypothetical protein SUGI_0295580 [Cryptomeria japonica]|nr:hypothetical protein SUGI_0295580 [Cryptomeria japonica]